jgi:hypothetical protein
MHGQRGNPRHCWTAQNAPNYPGHLDANSDNCRFPILFQMPSSKTASSYSGKSVPHYKACADGSKNGLVDTLAEIHAAMTSIPLETGFCPERWRQAVDVMLENIPGKARSNKLRIIQLLDGPEPIITSGICEKRDQIGLTPQMGNNWLSVWMVPSDVHLTDT